ncbi:MAG: heparinase II/III family protein [Paracoccus sp. (in: a-proteobacteria)]|nr:heparinase II/III family protein [Paracoccus sp. (in: a-proteobacteria)]
MTSEPTPRPYGFQRRPEPRAIGSAPRGQEILDGELRLTGGSLSGDPFAQEPPSPDYAAELHGFGWLDDLAAVGSAPARDLAQARVLDWVRAHDRVPAAAQAQPGPIWRADVTGRRVLRWIFHAGLILPGLDREAAQPFFNSLHDQLSLLAQAAPRAEAGQPQIEALAGLALAAMALKGAEDQADPALAALAEAARGTISGGALRSRNPEELLTCLSLLAWVKDAAGETGHALPRAINTLIGEIAPVLRALRHADGGLPRFHGGGRGVPGRLDHSLRAAEGPALTAKGHPMGYARLSRARASVILDASPPPAGAAAARAHASTLALELTSARHPVVVNCGSGRLFGPSWARASRATACHSTLSLSGLSSAKLLPADDQGQERLTHLPQRVWAGACDAGGNLLPPETPPAHPSQPSHILAGHDGWLGTHGLTHLRELWLAPDGDELRGEDTLAALDAEAQGRLDDLLARQPDGIAFDIRFHLHPAIEAEFDGEALRLSLPGGELWRFTHDGVAAVRLDPSAYLESGLHEPLAAEVIVLSAALTGRAIQIGWTFSRASGR